MNPYLIIGALLVIAVAAGSGYAKGHHDAAQACAIEKTEMIATAQKQKDAEAVRAAGASTTLEVENAKARIVYRTITKTVDRLVDRPVYRGQCFDDDGLRAVNAALAGKSPDSGQPNGPMPRPADTGNSDGRAGPSVNR